MYLLHLKQLIHIVIHIMSKTASALDMPQADECPLCIEKYNRTTKKCIACPYCDYKACATCMKRVILTQSQFHCINGDFDIVTVPSPVDPTQQIRQRKYRCGLTFTRRFLAENFTQSFVCTELKARRQDVLFELEQTHLPAAQTYAARRKRAQQNKYLRIKLNQDNYHIQLENRVTIAINELELYKLSQNSPVKTRSYEVKQRMNELKQQIFNLNKINNEIHRGRYAAPGQPAAYEIDTRVEPYRHEITGEEPNELTETVKPKVVLSFILRCPKPTCNGFINGETHLCGLCGIHVCPQCNVETEVDAAGRTRNHTCNPADKESYDMLKKDAKSCPRCTATIIKASGCDHMWCSSCKTHFNWRSGEILNHSSNPEYYEYLRRTNREIAREPGDNPDAVCVNGQGYAMGHNLISEFRRELSNMYIVANTPGYTYYDLIFNVIQFCEHLPVVFHNVDNENIDIARNSLILRAQYLNGEIDITTFKRRALLEVNRREFRLEKANIINTYRITMTDILNRYLEYIKESIRNYCNAAEIVPKSNTQTQANERRRIELNRIANALVNAAGYPFRPPVIAPEFVSKYDETEILQHQSAIIAILMDYKLEDEICNINEIINESLKITYKMFCITDNSYKLYIQYKREDGDAPPRFTFAPLPVISRKKTAKKNTDEPANEEANIA